MTPTSPSPLSLLQETPALLESAWRVWRQNGTAELVRRVRGYPRHRKLRESFENLAPWITGFSIDGRVYGGFYDALNDVRLALFLDKVSVKDKRVLEMGPLEGGHTLALARAGAAEITAVEGRSENIRHCRFIKDIFSLDHATFREGDVREVTREAFGAFDVAVCMGVLYHLPDPDRVLAQLRELAPITCLWTHVADEHHPIGGREGELGSKYGTFAGKFIGEDVEHPLSALDSEVIWLYEPDLLALIEAVGFRQCQLLGRWPAEDSPGPAILAMLET